MTVNNQQSVNRLRKLISQNARAIAEVKATLGDDKGAETVTQLEQLNQTIEELADFLERGTNLSD